MRVWCVYWHVDYILSFNLLEVHIWTAYCLFLQLLHCIFLQEIWVYIYILPCQIKKINQTSSLLHQSLTPSKSKILGQGFCCSHWTRHGTVVIVWQHWNALASETYCILLHSSAYHLSDHDQYQLVFTKYFLPQQISGSQWHFITIESMGWRMFTTWLSCSLQQSKYKLTHYNCISL